MSDVKKMSVKEFRELGYLQELNRKFLHPLGLALEVNIDKDGNESFGEVWDGRSDPEGWIYGEDIELDRVAVARIWSEMEMKKKAREEKLGFHIQPLP